MSQKQVQESHTNYMDAVRVKISEKYKPPPRINLAMTYSQRISMNKHLHDNLPKYEFSLETSVKDKMKEWRTARNLMLISCKDQLDKIKEERQKQYDIAKLDLKTKEILTEIINENNANFESNKEKNYTSTREGVLIPMQVKHTNILTPIPLINQSYTCKPTDKSPFNISDFEADTSSPFDNMELKTLNDMEELKLVLQNDDKKNIHSNIQNSYIAANDIHSYTGYSSQDHQYQFVPQSTVKTNQNFQPSNSSYNTSNGYRYYNQDTLHPNINSTYDNYIPVKTEYSSSFDAQTPQTTVDVNKMPFRSVPDIMKALQTELNNKHLGSNSCNPDHSTNVTSNMSDTSRSPNKDIYPDDKSNVDNLENPYEQLPQNLQDACDVISSMGFPLPRVARACKDIGDDNKKIVEHLLALSELLAFGFSETKVSSALIQCNNDRDKALELLIL